MSYYFEMSFANAPDLSEAYALCDRAAHRICELPAASERIRDSLPYIVDRFTEEDKERGLFRIYVDSWVRTLFDVRGVYWPEFHLFGISGPGFENVSDGICKPIPFQNGTDQDYHLDMWPDDIDVFRVIKRQVRSMPYESLTAALGWEIEEASPDDAEHEDYMRRTLVYRMVYDRLDLGRWLYGKEGNFKRMCMSGLTTREKANEMYTRALALAKHIR